MTYLTQEEKKAVTFLIIVIVISSFLKFLFQVNPSLFQKFEYIDSSGSYWKLNVNCANKEDLLAVPYIGEFTAQRILDYRLKNGRINDLKSIEQIPFIKSKNFEKFQSYLEVGDACN